MCGAETSADNCRIGYDTCRLHKCHRTDRVALWGLLQWQNGYVVFVLILWSLKLQEYQHERSNTGTSRTSKTAQAEILVTLGLLGKRFPASMSEWSKSIVGCCIHKIRSDPNKTPYVTFCGATKCLCSLLKDYSTHLAKDEIKFLYVFLFPRASMNPQCKHKHTLNIDTHTC